MTSPMLVRERAQAAEVLLRYAAGRTLRVEMDSVEAELDVRYDNDPISVSSWGVLDRAYMAGPRLVTLTLRGYGEMTRMQETRAAPAVKPAPEPEPGVDDGLPAWPAGTVEPAAADEPPEWYSRDLDRGRWLL